MIWRYLLVITELPWYRGISWSYYFAIYSTCMIWRRFLVILLPFFFTALKWYGDISWSYCHAFYSTLMIWRHFLVILPCFLQPFHDMAAFPGHITSLFTVLLWYCGISWSYYIAYYSTNMAWRHFLFFTLLFTVLSWYGGISWSYYLASYSTFMIWRHFLIALPCF